MYGKRKTILSRASQYEMLSRAEETSKLPDPSSDKSFHNEPVEEQTEPAQGQP